MNEDGRELEWHRVLAADELPEGRVTTVAAGHQGASRSSTTTGVLGALDNHCPHQGGPLGEGSIENGLLRCPWHGYDYCPLDRQVARRSTTRRPRYPLEVRDGGVYVGVRRGRARRAPSPT